MIMKNSDFLKNSTIAHRGIFDNKKTAENTINAFKKAITKGYTIELDLHLTKDNKVVVSHDDKVDRLSNEKGFIKDKTLEELRNIKLLDGSVIPTFDEVLELVNGKVPLLIELKYSKGFRLEKEVINRLDNYKGEFAIQSFIPSTIIYFRLFRKNYLLGLLVGPKHNTVNFINTCKPDFINVNKDLIDDKKVQRFKGIKLTYLVDKKEKDKYIDKCDNVICNI